MYPETLYENTSLIQNHCKGFPVFLLSFHVKMKPNHQIVAWYSIDSTECKNEGKNDREPLS